MLKRVSLSRFFEEFQESLNSVDDWNPPFTLVLGAGASCSAGIPLTARMMDLLRRWYVLQGVTPPEPDEDFSSFLEEFPDHDMLPYFISRCVRRGSREPNLTHLIAANLACVGVFNAMVTTNFDDLTLAGFWALPANSYYQEPYVIYDPRAIRLSRISLDEIPIIVKAHGHYTQWALGLLDGEIRDLAPHVRRVIRWCQRQHPSVGYIVVGYSGAWADGVMEALKSHSSRRAGKIYWFFRRNLPSPLPPPLRELVEICDVHFVRCDDSDYLFLKLWNLLDDGLRGGILSRYDLFAPPRNRARGLSSIPLPRWWTPPKDIRGKTGSQLLDESGIVELRRKLLPVLNKIDFHDNGGLMEYDCLSEDWRHLTDFFGLYKATNGEPPGLTALSDALGSSVSWTRRNRKLLRLALDIHSDPDISFGLLNTLNEIATI
jgi:hypothetical protein